MPREKAPGETPTPEPESSGAQGSSPAPAGGDQAPWRNEREIKQAIIRARKAHEALEQVQAQLAELKAGTTGGATPPPPAGQGGSSKLESQLAELAARVQDAERSAAWHRALAEVELTKPQRAILQDLFEAARPEDPGEWLAEKIKAYGFTPAPDDDDHDSGSRGGATPPATLRAAPGRDPGATPADPRVLAKENPAAWKAMTREQRREVIAKYKRSQTGGPLFPRSRGGPSQGA